MTPRTLIERQQFIEEEVKKLINRRGIIMGGFFDTLGPPETEILDSKRGLADTGFLQPQ